MSIAIRLSSNIYNDVKLHASAESRSVPKQIEHWIRIGKIAEENPDLSCGMIKSILLSLEEVEAGEISDYKFGSNVSKANQNL